MNRCAICGSIEVCRHRTDDQIASEASDWFAPKGTNNIGTGFPQDITKRFFPKRHARSILSQAIKNGQLKRPQHCDRCRVKCFPHAHHKDYDKPLDVEWLCRRCHTGQHYPVDNWLWRGRRDRGRFFWALFRPQGLRRFRTAFKQKSHRLKDSA